ncbi:MAG: hypothetical protein GX922_05665 [Firmicutes bacterium]|nr:hypothetical protein [Bacillota bacterium]
MTKNKLFLGQKITVSAQPQDDVYLSMIQEIEEQTLAITLPVLHGQYLLLHQGDSIQVQFTSEDAAYAFTSTVVDRKKSGEVSLLLITRPSTITRSQRRQLFRMPLVMPCYFTLPHEDVKEQQFKGKTRDLSGSGLRFTCEQPLQRDDLLTVSFTLPGETKQEFKLPSLVRWSKKCAENMITVGVKFIEISYAEQEKIISYIFARLRHSMPLARGEKK